MKPRERILRALDHKEADSIPIDLGSTESTGMTWKAYSRLLDHLGIVKDIFVFDMIQLISKVDTEIIELTGADALPLVFEPKKWKDWEFEKGKTVKIPHRANLLRDAVGNTLLFDRDSKNAVAKLPNKGYYFDTIYHPLEDAENSDDIDRAGKYFDSYDLPYYFDEDIKTFGARAEELHLKTDYAVVGNLWVHLLAAGQELRGFGKFMMDLVQNKPLAKKMLQTQVEAYLPRIDSYIDAAGKYLDIIQVNDDLGTQSGPQIGRELYREMIKPFHKKLWGYIKEKSKKPILLHSCGSIYDLIPDLIEIGIDALNPVQVSASNMDTGKLKKEFGRDITFWGGGCDTQRILPYGTPEEIRLEVRKRVEDLAPGGGFVFCQVHNIQPDVPPENILAMYEELREINGARNQN